MGTRGDCAEVLVAAGKRYGSAVASLRIAIERPKTDILWRAAEVEEANAALREADRVLHECAIALFERLATIAPVAGVESPLTEVEKEALAAHVAVR